MCGPDQKSTGEPSNRTGVEFFNDALTKDEQPTAPGDTTPAGLSDPDLWEASSSSLSKNGIVEFNEGDARVMIMKDDTRLVPVVRTEEEMFTNTATDAAQSNDLDVVVNAHQFEFKALGLADYAIGDDPVDPDGMLPQGLTMENGRVLAGRSSPDTFYIAQKTDASGGVNNEFGFGDPPEDSTVAFGGGFPIIIDGQKYNEENVYAPGTSNKAPSSGDPGEYKDQLLMRSNNGYKAFVQKYEQVVGDASTGKVVVAHNSSNNTMAVVVQPNGADDGIFLSELRDKLADAGFDNAIAYDGSSSATLVKDGQLEIEPSHDKNKTVNTGIGFDINEDQLENEPPKDDNSPIKNGT
jgi:hypothetical protein